MCDRPRFLRPITLSRYSRHTFSVRAYPIYVFHSSSVCFAYYVCCYWRFFFSSALDVFCGLFKAINSLGVCAGGTGEVIAGRVGKVAENSSRTLREMNKSSFLFRVD